MKYIVVLGDGMADLPIDALGGKTPLEAAATPTLDTLASAGIMGLTQNVPAMMHPGSEIANLSVLGYDPRTDFTGRSPLEALSVGVEMGLSDVILRANLVTLTENEPYGEKTILDHSAGEISTEDADILMDAVRQSLNTDTIHFYTGTSYRHICRWQGGQVVELQPPHDHLTQVIGPHLPQHPALREMMVKSFDILNNHPLNLKRAKKGLNKANSLWFWGAGTKPNLAAFEGRTGLRGAMISAVDLLKGIAVGAGMQVYHIPGATGSLHTNYEGKAQAAIDALLQDGMDFVYIHLEGPDEMGHQGLLQEKIQSIEFLDSRIVAPVKKSLEAAGEEFRMLVLPDHPTPIAKRTHTADPVPFVLYDSTRQQRKIARYNEKEAAMTGLFLPEGHRLLAQLLR